MRLRTFASTNKHRPARRVLRTVANVRTPRSYWGPRTFPSNELRTFAIHKPRDAYACSSSLEVADRANVRTPNYVQNASLLNQMRTFAIDHPLRSVNTYPFFFQLTCERSHPSGEASLPFDQIANVRNRPAHTRHLEWLSPWLLARGRNELSAGRHPASRSRPRCMYWIQSPAIPDNQGV